MNSALFATSATLYAAACLLYIVSLARVRVNDNSTGLNKSTSRASVVANAVMMVAVVLHIVLIVVTRSALGLGTLAPSTIQSVLSVLAAGIAVLFLVASLSSRMTALGVFVAPVTLMMMLASALGEHYAPVTDGVRSALLYTHVLSNTLGLAASTLAFGAAAGYLVQERLLRKRRLSGVFQRLPALGALDTFSLRALTIAFPLLTLGMVSGSLWLVREGSGAIALQQLFGIATWMIFGTVLLLRVMTGWQGRRAAFGTIAGFVCAVGVLAGYMLRAGAV